MYLTHLELLIVTKFMMKRISLPIRMPESVIILALAIWLAPSMEAKDEGERLFKQNCSACHGMAGEGAANGIFPPLADSPWVKGDPERAIQVLLHGLEGPIDVDGKIFNLAMPPQGAMLGDTDIAAVLSYVRQSFGNAESVVSVEQVAKARKWSAKRGEPWTAISLLEHYPLAKTVSPIKNLLMEVYHGQWKKMPDFESIEWVAFEEEHDGIISLKNIKKKDGFAVVWKGDLEVPTDGEYSFELDSDDGSRVLIDGKNVADLAKPGPLGRWQKGKVTLSKGSHPIRLEYFEISGNQGIHLRWSGPGIKGKQWLSNKPQQTRRGKTSPVIDLTPKLAEAVIYNNFITGTSPRALGVGYPEGQNIAFSTQHCSVELIWRGNFISGGRHWTGRGQGAEAPMSAAVTSLSQTSPFQFSAKPLNDWSKSDAEKVQFKGYVLDADRKPTFRYSVGEIAIVESITASVVGLERRLVITSPREQNLAYLVDSGEAKIEGNKVLLENDLSIEGPGDYLKCVEGSFTNLALKKGVNTITFIYSWN